MQRGWTDEKKGVTEMRYYALSRTLKDFQVLEFHHIATPSVPHEFFENIILGWKSLRKLTSQPFESILPILKT